MVAAQVHVEPADDDGHGAVRAHADEEERRVLDVRAIMDGEEDGEARDGDADGPQGVGEAVAGEVAADGDEHREGEGGGPGRHAVQLGLDGAVVVGLDNGGGEVGISVGGSGEGRKKNFEPC